MKALSQQLEPALVERVTPAILISRAQCGLQDCGLAVLHRYEAKGLDEQARRNPECFVPSDSIFELTSSEYKGLQVMIAASSRAMASSARGNNSASGRQGARRHHGYHGAQ